MEREHADVDLGEIQTQGDERFGGVPAHLAVLVAKQCAEHHERFGFAVDGEPAFGEVHGIAPAFGVFERPAANGVRGAVQLLADHCPVEILDAEFGGLHEPFVVRRLLAIA